RSIAPEYGRGCPYQTDEEIRHARFLVAWRGGRSLVLSTTNKSTSLYGCGCPYAYEPNRIIRSGSNLAAMRLTTSLMARRGIRVRMRFSFFSRSAVLIAYSST